MRILLPLLALATPLPAHELWLEPAAYMIPRDGMVIADIVNGQQFKGIGLPFLSHMSTRLEVTGPTGTTPLTPRMGDRPAAAIAPQGDGLHVLAYETAPAQVTYDSAEKFAQFARDKGADWAIAQTPPLPFTESYTRHVKALICVTSCTGADRPLGLATEFVALTPPGPDMRLRLLYQGSPRPDAQVTLFAKSPNGVETIRLTTDAQGELQFATQPGHSYLADAVVFEHHKDARPWHTLWAALTFMVPQ